MKITKVHLKSDRKPKANSNFKLVNVVKPVYKHMKNEINGDLNTQSSFVKRPADYINLDRFNENLLKNQFIKQTSKFVAKTIFIGIFLHQ